MLRFVVLAVCVLVLGAGCVGQRAVVPIDDVGAAQASEKKSLATFEDLLERLVTHDMRRNWTVRECNSVAQKFDTVAGRLKQRRRGEALYNAALAYQRCGLLERARAELARALSADPSLHRARARLALYEYKKTRDLQRAIAALKSVVHQAKFQDPEALVDLAALQMASFTTSSDLRELEQAKQNLQRALAIDDGCMPAYNQLAIYYLQLAKAAASGDQSGRRNVVLSSSRRVEPSRQQLDMAVLVASHGLKKDPGYAPLHNTTGLIQTELRHFNDAVRSFDRARELDPEFFEAHMNYAAVSLGIRGFEQAEGAYRQAARLRPEDYEARLGLALAIRGRIRPGKQSSLADRAKEQLDRAKRIAPRRPEAYYNEAILMQLRAKNPAEKSEPLLERAFCLYSEFNRRAQGDPAFVEAAKRATDQKKDILDTLAFIGKRTGPKINCE